MLSTSLPRRSSGLTLVELMIAIAINAFLLTALLTIFLANMDHYRRSLNASRLNQELQTAMDIMLSDIRRAGYWSNVQTDVGTHQNNNPFMASGADLSINGSNNCILFTYDYNNNGSLPSIASGSEDERYGFRLNNQAIQARPPGASFDCAAAATAWENMTDSSVVQITALSFTLTTRNITTGPSTRGITMRSVDISITGQLTSDATVSKTITGHVRIRNDKFIP